VRARIHRGAREVGGSCVELEASGAVLLLDVGLPLDAADAAMAELPEIARSGDPRLLGVVISHAHPDHYGLATGLHPGLRVFMGEAATNLLRVSARYTGMPPPAVTDYLVDRASLKVGGFTITPYLVDHSAYDAYALLIEADDRRIFYSGDLRAHGRKPGTFERLVEHPPPEVDALLLEGTTVCRARGGERDEASVEHQCAEVFRATAGLALALYSPQNIDRLVTVYRAAKRAGRVLVLDLYAAEVAATLGRSTIPQTGWDGVRVYVPDLQRSGVIRSGEFERIEAVRTSRIFIEELMSESQGFVMTFRASMARELENALDRGDSTAVWMMWPGYLDMDRGRETRKLLQGLGIELTIAHASGHAAVADLQRLARAIDAARVAPIHTAAADAYDQLYARVEPHPDGEWWEI
jgi:ribonuclease J